MANYQIAGVYKKGGGGGGGGTVGGGSCGKSNGNHVVCPGKFADVNDSSPRERRIFLRGMLRRGALI